MKKLIILVVLVALFAPIRPVAAQIATSTSPSAVTTEQALISALNQLIKILLVQLDSLQKQLAVEIAKVQTTQQIQQTQINTIVENTTVSEPVVAPTPEPDITSPLALTKEPIITLYRFEGMPVGDYHMRPTTWETNRPAKIKPFPHGSGGDNPFQHGCSPWDSSHFYAGKTYTCVLELYDDYEHNLIWTKTFTVSPTGNIQ